MSRIAFVDGQYLLHCSAAAHIEDRGDQSADGVYEVMPVVRAHLVYQKPHLDPNLRELYLTHAVEAA